MTPADFQRLEKGDVVQDLESGKAYVIANVYDESTHSVDVFEIRSVDITRANHFKKVQWPN